MLWHWEIYIKAEAEEEEERRRKLNFLAFFFYHRLYFLIYFYIGGGDPIEFEAALIVEISDPPAALHKRIRRKRS